MFLRVFVIDVAKMIKYDHITYNDNLNDFFEKIKSKYC